MKKNNLLKLCGVGCLMAVTQLAFANHSSSVEAVHNTSGVEANKTHEAKCSANKTKEHKCSAKKAKEYRCCADKAGHHKCSADKAGHHKCSAKKAKAHDHASNVEAAPKAQ